MAGPPVGDAVALAFGDSALALADAALGVAVSLVAARPARRSPVRAARARRPARASASDGLRILSDAVLLHGVTSESPHGRLVSSWEGASSPGCGGDRIAGGWRRGAGHLSLLRLRRRERRRGQRRLPARQAAAAAVRPACRSTQARAAPPAPRNMTSAQRAHTQPQPFSTCRETKNARMPSGTARIAEPQRRHPGAVDDRHVEDGEERHRQEPADHGHRHDQQRERDRAEHHLGEQVEQVQPGGAAAEMRAQLAPDARRPSPTPGAPARRRRPADSGPGCVRTRRTATRRRRRRAGSGCRPRRPRARRRPRSR